MTCRTLLALTLGLLMSQSIAVCANAQSRISLSMSEIQRIRQQFERAVPMFHQSSQFGPGRRDGSIAAFEQAWSQRDAAIAPFLGTWHSQDTSYSIYPSRTPGRVCVIFESPAADIVPNNLAFGTVNNGALIVTGINTMTGRNNMLILRESTYLSVASIEGNQSSYYPYSAFSTTLSSPAYLLGNGTAMQQFNSAECTTALP